MQVIASLLVEQQWRQLRDVYFEELDLGGAIVRVISGTDSTLNKVSFPLDKVSGLKYVRQADDIPVIHKFEV